MAKFFWAFSTWILHEEHDPRIDISLPVKKHTFWVAIEEGDALFSWCVTEVTEAVVASNVEAAVDDWGPDTIPPTVGTAKALLAIPFLLASIPCETSLLQDELSLTSFFVPVAVAAEAVEAVDLDGGCWGWPSALFVEFLRAALGEAGGKGCLLTTETTLWVCSHILLNRRKLPEKAKKKFFNFTHFHEAPFFTLCWALFK